jgi:hypothetical protein
LIGGGEIFRDDARVADGGHEVCVANPARKDVDVNVIHDTGAGGFSQVHAKIEAGGLIDFAQRRLAPLRQIHQLIGSFFRGGVELANVLVGNHEQVAADVWVDIENYEIVVSTVKNEILQKTQPLSADFAASPAAMYS